MSVNNATVVLLQNEGFLSMFQWSKGIIASGLTVIFGEADCNAYTLEINRLFYIRYVTTAQLKIIQAYNRLSLASYDPE